MHRIIFFILLFTCSILSFSQEFSNVNFYKKEGKIIITYDLINTLPHEVYDIKLKFTTLEQEYAEKRATIFQHYAARFAAKEAFFKALGTGYRFGMAFHEIEVENDELGKPVINLHGKVKEYIEKQGITHIHLSISHVKEMASAFVILEK
jgi:holo-[acyl-carrier protein] synthase